MLAGSLFNGKNEPESVCGDGVFFVFSKLRAFVIDGFYFKEPDSFRGCIAPGTFDPDIYFLAITQPFPEISFTPYFLGLRSSLVLRAFSADFFVL